MDGTGVFSGGLSSSRRLRSAVGNNSSIYGGTPRDTIEITKADSSRFPVPGLAGGRLVTFFVLHRQKGVRPYFKNPKAIDLRSFSTDDHDPGRGLAKRALRLLPDFVRTHFPEIGGRILAVNVKNRPAQH